MPVLQTVEIITRAERYRRWSLEDKHRILTECNAPKVVVADVVRRYGLRTNQIYNWRKKLI